MKKNRSMSPKVFFGLVLVITAAVAVFPKWAFAQTPPPGATVAATPDPLPPAPTAPALPPPPPPPHQAPSGPQQPVAQGTPPVAYPNAQSPYPPIYPKGPTYDEVYPEELPYEEGATVPMGYRKVETRRTGLLVAGITTFTTFYAITVFGALVSGEGKYAIPVIGPFLGIERASGNILNSSVTSIANMIFVIDGLAQAAGVGMLIAGIPTKTTLVRNDMATFKPEFSVGPGSVSMRMRF